MSIAPPPALNAATQAACVKILAALPLQLTASLPARRIATDSAYVRAWGEPPIVLRCGVPLPTDLTPQHGEDIVSINGVSWLPVQTSDATVFTSVDRSVAVEVSVPKASVDQPLPIISTAVATLPAVCGTIDAAGNHPAGLPICGTAR